MKLIAACTLIGRFVAPPGWSIVEAWVWHDTCAGNNCLAVSMPYSDPTITIERIVKPGDTIEVPSNCKLRAEEK